MPFHLIPFFENIYWKGRKLYILAVWGTSVSIWGLVGPIASIRTGCLAGWLAGWLAGLLAGSLAGWFAGLLACCFGDWLADWLTV